MAILPFLLGLSLGCSGGLALWLWQRSQFDQSLSDLLSQPQITIPERVGSPISRLASGLAQQKKRATQLEADLLSLSQALSQAPIGYLLVNQDNQLLICNAKACQLLEIHDWPQATRFLLEVVRSYEVDQLIEQTRRSQKKCERTWNFQATGHLTHTLQPTTRVLKGVGLPLPHHHVGVFIEDRQEILLLTQQRDRWASDVAHELRTPLTSIRLITETLQSRADSSQRQWLDRLLTEVIRLSSLVQDLLELGALKADLPKVREWQYTDIVQLIQTAWKNLEPLAIQKQLLFVYKGSTTLTLQADEPRLYRLLLNLLDNSIKFSPSHHSIQVQLSTHAYLDPILPRWLPATEPVDNWIYLQVIDSGCGFNPQDLPYVFDRFYRADTSRTRTVYTDGAVPATSEPGSTAHSAPESGSGLGLAIARQIVEAHNGAIRASNHPTTGGAWLEVLIPWKQ